MSGGVVSPGRAPRTGPEWVRDLQGWRRKADSQQAVRIGEFVLLPGDDGNLWLHKPGQSPLMVGKEPDVTELADQMRGVVVTPDELANVIAGDAEEGNEATPLERIGSFLEDKWTQATETVTNVGRQAANLLDLFAAPFDVPPADFDPLNTFLKGPSQAAQNAVDDIVKGLGGFAGSFFPRSDYQRVVDNTAAQLQQLAAAVAELRAQSDNASNSGKSYFEDFTTLPNSTDMPAGDWTVTITGSGSGQTFGILDGKAQWTNLGTGDRYAHVRYNYDTDTDYQLAGCVFTAQPGSRYIPGPFPWSPDVGAERYYAANFINVRRSPDNLTRVEVGMFGDNTLNIVYWVDGVATTAVAFLPGFTFKANTAYYVQAGTPGNIRTFRLLEGGSLTPIYTWTDTGAVSALGPGFRRASWINQIYQGAVGAPASAFLLRDNTPAAYIGETARVSRTLSAGISHPAAPIASPAHFVAGLFDTVDYITSGITWDGTRFTVTSPGEYHVSARIKGDNSNFMELGLFRRPAGSTTDMLAKWGLGASGGTAIETIGSGVIYLQAGDAVELAYFMTVGAKSLSGESTGTQTYLEIRKV